MELKAAVFDNTQKTDEMKTQMDNMKLKLNDMDKKIVAIGKDLKDFLNSQKQNNGNSDQDSPFQII